MSLQSYASGTGADLSAGGAAGGKRVLTSRSRSEISDERVALSSCNPHQYFLGRAGRCFVDDHNAHSHYITQIPSAKRSLKINKGRGVIDLGPGLNWGQMETALTDYAIRGRAETFGANIVTNHCCVSDQIIDASILPLYGF